MRKTVSEADLIRKLRGRRSFRDFENYVNENIPAGMPGITTFASAWNWVHEVWKINGATLMAWREYYPDGDPRHQTAVAILALRQEEYALEITK